jgi:hypothetical protein
VVVSCPRKNALEAFIYALRSKLYENLAPFVQEVRNIDCWYVQEWGRVFGRVHINRLQPPGHLFSS